MWLRTLLFYFLYTFSLLIISSIGILFIFSPYSWRYFWLSQWAKFNIYSLEKIIGISANIKGKENIPYGQKQVVVLANHQSTWETLFFQTLFGQQTWLLKKELLFIPIFGWSLALLKPIAIDRSRGVNAIHKLLKDGEQRINQGIWLIIFPEGTRQNDATKNHKLKKGGMKLAAQTDCTIVMIRHNSGKFWPKKGHFQSGKIELEIAPSFKSNNLEQIEQKCLNFFYNNN